MDIHISTRSEVYNVDDSQCYDNAEVSRSRSYCGKGRGTVCLPRGTGAFLLVQTSVKLDFYGLTT